MNEPTAFEKRIKQTYRLPEMDPVFYDHLEVKLKAFHSVSKVKAKGAFHLSRGWIYAMIVPLVICALTLTIGPSRVWAQILSALGVVPGIGLVDTSSPFRQLAEPVSDTKDGITLAIKSAFLSADQTVITYTMSDLPVEIKPAKFGDPECSTPAYLTLPDGSKVEASATGGNLAPDGSFVYDIRFSGPFPANFDRATLVFPCLEGTARGSGPEDWPMVLTFKPASEDVTVYPATLMPSPASVENPAVVKPPIVDGDHQEGMVVLGVVEKPDSYWITWAYPDTFDKDVRANNQLYVVPFNPVLYDANGTELPEPGQDIQLELWKYEGSLVNQLSDQDKLKYTGSLHTFVVPKSGVAFPVYAKQDVYERSFPEKKAYADFEFDGSQVQTSDKPVEINQEIQIGSIKFKLVSIGKSQYGGYTFNFDGQESKVITAEVDLVGYDSDLHGSDSFNLNDPYHFSTSVMYTQIPAGKLTVRISYPAVLGDKISFIGSWSPDQK